MSRMFSNPWVILLAIPFTLGGAAFSMFTFWGFGWWWDGASLFLFGMFLGQSIGLTVMGFVPRWQESDAHFMLCAQVCAVVMITLWLCLPEEIVTILVHIARALFGGGCGLILAFGLAGMGYPYEPRPHSDSETGGPNGAIDMSHE
jgi:hypothetical protein